MLFFHYFSSGEHGSPLLTDNNFHIKKRSGRQCFAFANYLLDRNFTFSIFNFQFHQSSLACLRILLCRKKSPIETIKKITEQIARAIRILFIL